MTSFVDELTGELSIDHLSPEAIAALVDGELPRRAEHRAKVHLVHCTACREEVNAQRKAARRLREQSLTIQASGSLLDRLKSIPDASQELDEHTGSRPEGAKPSCRVDGCRKPETVGDWADLLLRKIQRKR